MYGTGVKVTALPATGTGAAAVVIGSASEDMTLLSIALILLGVWTMQACLRAALRMAPKREV